MYQSSTIFSNQPTDFQLTINKLHSKVVRVVLF